VDLSEVKNYKMLFEECKDCSYLLWGVGIGMGVRCKHTQNRTEKKPPMPLISEVKDCKLYKKIEADES
jgi:hypothetical protein